MLEIKGDPVIKLFGRTIPLPPLLTAAGDASVSGSGGVGGDDGREEEKDTRKKSSELPSSPAHESSKSPPGQEKTLKKPEKILPCPRCKSLDTKFCYFNNYNLNQPRHFCKNCQRYWTAGGTTRNVPVGAGRRKHKSHRHITILADKPIDESAPSSSSDATTATMQCPRIRAPQCPYPWSTPNPVLFAPNFPIAFFPPTAYWGTDPCPWLSPVAPSPTWGKNSRERDDDKQERCLWAPKTLRIDSPGDAAKGSIWAMLGDKKKAFQTKAGSEDWRAASEASGVFQANPAALSRSLNFQESS